MSIEQCVRDILTAAVRSELVRLNDGVDPQDMSATELTAPANRLTAFLVAEVAARDDRWQAAVGHSLETAERLAQSPTPTSNEATTGTPDTSR